jgi:guanine nucleotide-binding protein subunit alpha
MRIINAGGFNKTERKQWRAIIFNNLVSAYQTIFAAMQEQETDFEDEDNLVGSLTTARTTDADLDSDLPNSLLLTPRSASTNACRKSVLPR